MDRDLHGSGKCIHPICLDYGLNLSSLETQIWHSPVSKHDYWKSYRWCLYIFTYVRYHNGILWHCGRHHRWELPGNYPYLQKYGNLPLCLENYELFSLLPIFTKIYIYTLRYIIYLGEPSVNIISTYQGTFIHIFMHGYDPNLNIYILNRFSVNVAVLFANVSSFLPMLLLKPFHFLQVDFSLELISLKFLSYRLSQANLLQNLIRFQ